MKRKFLNKLGKNIASIKSRFVKVENKRKKKWGEEGNMMREEKGIHKEKGKYCWRMEIGWRWIEMSVYLLLLV